LSKALSEASSKRPELDKVSDEVSDKDPKTRFWDKLQISQANQGEAEDSRIAKRTFIH